jgi:hypothetical protein
MTIQRRHFCVLLPAVAALPALAQFQAAPPSYRSINWAALAPPGWDAMKGFRSADLQALDDGDPRAAELLKKMREAWDKAPVNMALMNQAVRIAGYVVPLEEGKEGLTEFLLVPYHGACVHSPPPPANQIVHVLSRSPVKGVRSMDTVAVSGVLQYTRSDTAMGLSSWRISAVGVEPYTDTALPGGAQRVR